MRKCVDMLWVDFGRKLTLAVNCVVIYGEMNINMLYKYGHTMFMGRFFFSRFCHYSFVHLQSCFPECRRI